MMIELPKDVKTLINTLENEGYEAYLVGGCVRDLLLGMSPHDWDITTDALPEEIIDCFSDKTIVKSGLKYGTVMVVENGIAYEITTFRIDQGYSDRRRPDAVLFTACLQDDLSRRDFSINAMAYHPKVGLIDYFGGEDDLQNKIIRCIGNADDRFNEDALRILRALRFASVLGFEIEETTSKSIDRNKDLLKDIAIERINIEFCKLICGGHVKEVLLNYADVFAVFIPEIWPMFGFEQNSPHHYLNVWEHTVETVAQTPEDLILRLTLFFHDIAKPKCYFESEDGFGHFCGHPKYSENMAYEIMKRMKFDNKTIEIVGELVRYHDIKIEAEGKQVKRLLGKIGEERFRQLILVKRADISSQSPQFREERLEKLNDLLQFAEGILAEEQCFQIKDLAIDGNDLLEMGIPQGILMGKILHQLFDQVLNDAVPNDKQTLLDAAKEIEQKLS